MNRVGQVWRETNGTRCIAVVVDDVDHERHKMLILTSCDEFNVLQTQAWYENENIGDWDTYDGIERLS